MRYEVHPCDDGRYFITDTTTGAVMCWVGCELVARKTARIMNECPDNLDGCSCLDSTKLH